MTETIKRMQQDTRLWAAAHQLVKDMNPHEASRFYKLPYWPGWAQRDVELAYLALRKAKGL